MVDALPWVELSIDQTGFPLVLVEMAIEALCHQVALAPVNLVLVFQVVFLSLELVVVLVFQVVFLSLELVVVVVFHLRFLLAIANQVLLLFLLVAMVCLLASREGVLYHPNREKFDPVELAFLLE